MGVADPPPRRREVRLRLDGKDVAALRPGASITIGRLADNSVVLESARVSRNHARLEWPAGAERPLIVDLGSANGVLLDEFPVKELTYFHRDWGQIELGGFVLHYRLEDQDNELRSRSYNLPDDSGEFVLEEGAREEGSLEDNADLHELLVGLERAGRSGTLELMSPAATGLILFATGKIMDARRGPLTGLAALERLLELFSAGSYRFDDQLKPTGAFLNLSIREFLERGF